jgi:hypothetical protein
MGNTNSSSLKVNYEDIQYVIAHAERGVLINTLASNEQTCLIPNTVPILNEEKLINELLKKNTKNVKIIIYGKNSNDEKIYSKQSQLISLGFQNVYLYTGGMFEWLMLQDIYGIKEFPTTCKELDILKYKSNKMLNVLLLE